MASVIHLKTRPTRSEAAHVYRLPRPIKMRRGGVLDLVDIAFETWGELSPSKDNAVLLLTGLSPSAHAASSAQDPTPGWWEHIVGPSLPIDTNRYFVICVNSLGSCFGSTGPASINPATGQSYRLSFPELSVEDIAVSARFVVQSLGIHELHTVIGPSLGGMSALAYALEFPNEVRRFAGISAALNSSPFAIAIRALQRDMIRKDPSWRNGNYPPDKPPVEGIRLARKLGLMSYRSAQEWQARFGRKRIESDPRHIPPFEPEFQVESYLAHNAEKFVNSFDANAYLYLSRAMDWFDVSEYGESLEAVLSRLQTESNLVIGVESDMLFPIWQQEQIATLISAVGRNVIFKSLPSLQGHDAFLADKERFAPIINDFFAQ